MHCLIHMAMHLHFIFEQQVIRGLGTVQNVGGGVGQCNPRELISSLRCLSLAFALFLISG